MQHKTIQTLFCIYRLTIDILSIKKETEYELTLRIKLVKRFTSVYIGNYHFVIFSNLKKIQSYIIKNCLNFKK